MHRVVILSIVAVVASAADIDTETCKRSMHPGIMRCCKNDPLKKFMMLNGAEECFQIARDPVSCARDICLAKKKGFLTADEKLDKTKLEEILTKDIDNQPEFLENIKNNCINGDLAMFGPSEFCELMKMRHCMLVEAVQLCSDWNDEDFCKGTKELVKECTKLFS